MKRGLAVVVAALLLSSGLESRPRPLGEQVIIRRDTFRVPHILAETDEAAAFGLGDAQAEAVRALEQSECQPD